MSNIKSNKSYTYFLIIIILGLLIYNFQFENKTILEPYTNKLDSLVHLTFTLDSSNKQLQAKLDSTSAVLDSSLLTIKKLKYIILNKNITISKLQSIIDSLN